MNASNLKDQSTPETDDFCSCMSNMTRWPDFTRHLERQRDEARALVESLSLHLQRVLEEYDDRKAQWGNEYLWEKHEDAEVIAKAKEAVQ